MAKLIFIHSEGIFRQNRTLMTLESEEATVDELNNMQNAFEGQPKKGYSITYDQLNGLLKRTLALNQTGYLTGLIVLPGRDTSSDDFIIVMEPLFYKKPGTTISEISPLTGDDYFGLSSANKFSDYYEKTAGRESTRSFISRKDDKPGVTATHAILIDNNWLIKLQKLLVIGMPVDLFLGRTTDDRLTMILVGKITENLLSELYLDHHDLIPPPDPSVLA